jgi:hypothetical protein
MNFKKTKILFIVLGVLFVSVPIAIFLQLEWRFSISRAFFKTVAALPREQLANFSSRCGGLYTNFYKNELSITITNKEILEKFVLAEKSPKDIYISDGIVVVEYVVADVGTDIQWMDFSPNESTWKLEGHSPAGGLMLYDPRQNE